MKIHLQSDTHVEMGGSTMEGMVCSDVTVCAGDIGLISNLVQLETYFNKIKENTEHVIWVLGNHEFYGYGHKQGLEDALAFAERHDIHLLDEALGTDNLEIDGVTFWGSTLWTDCKKDDWFARKKIGKALADFHVIDNDHGFASKTFHVDDSIVINKRTREKINWDADVIITHHMPIMIPNPKFPADDMSYAFGNTGLELDIMESKIKYWLYGHTHHSASMELDGTLVVSNQHGYIRPAWNGQDAFKENAGFDPRFILEI